MLLTSGNFKGVRKMLNFGKHLIKNKRLVETELKSFKCYCFKCGDKSNTRKISPARRITKEKVLVVGCLDRITRYIIWFYV